MGWSSGSDLADKIERIMEKAADRFTPGEIEKMGRDLAAAFEAMDCDTLEECRGFIGDAANRMAREYDGAPRKPKTGDVHRNKHDEEYTFNGKRWVYVND